MLYISRQIGVDKYGVVDTDDGQEDVLNRKQIEHVVVDLHIPIEGATIFEHPTHHYKYLSGVEVIQPNMTRQQLKSKVLQGIDVRYHEGVVTAISVMYPDTTIRLKDYGTEFGNYVFWFNRVEPNTIFVFDDGLKFNSKTFKDWRQRGIVMDLSNVTDMKIVNRIYDDFAYDMEVDVSFIQFYYLDKPERRWYCEALWIINNGHVIDIQTGIVQRIIKCLGSGDKLIHDRYLKEFYSLFKSRLEVRSELRGALRSQSNMFKNSWFGCCEYQVLRDEVSKTLVVKLANDTTLSAASLRRLLNYVQFFNPPDEFRKAFVTFCNKALSWYKSFWKT